MTRLAGGILVVLACSCGPERGVDDGTGTTVATSSSVSEASSSTSSTTGADTSTAGDVATGGSVPLPMECSCRDIVADDLIECDDAAATECIGEPLCPTLAAECPRPGADLYDCQNEYVFDPEVMHCVVTALRDRTVGKLLVSLPTAACGLEGCGTDQRELTITSVGQIVVRSCYQEPMSDASSSSAIFEPSEPAHFDECLTLASTTGQYACVFDGLARVGSVCE